MAEDMHRAVLGLRDFFQCPAVVDITDAETFRGGERRPGHAEQQATAAVFTPKV